MGRLPASLLCQGVVSFFCSEKVLSRSEKKKKSGESAKVFLGKRGVGWDGKVELTFRRPGKEEEVSLDLDPSRREGRRC